MPRFLKSVFLVGAILSSQANTADADALATEGTRGSITPYVWGTSVTGDASVGPLSTEVDLSFSDMLEDLEFALMVEGEYWNGRWGLLGNLMHSNQQSNGGGVLATTTDIKMTMLGAAVAYRFGPFPNSANRTLFDAYAGLRYTKMDVTLTTGGGASASREIDFTDPVIGGRFFIELNPESRMLIGGDIGGFGVGSDLSWQLYGFYARDVKLGRTPATVSLGYRALGQDYTTGGTVPLTIDTTYHGPVVALSFHF